MENVLSLSEVVKTYGQQTAVDRVSFEVPQGSIFGLLGPNGAGKTTLIRIITSIIKADSGSLSFLGEKLQSRHSARIGYMPEERGLYRKMKVGDHLLYLAQLKGLSAATAKEKIQHWFEKFKIEEWYSKKVEELSKGMQQKIQFIATVIHQPPLLILDEPFSGLDPLNTNLIKQEIHQLREAGTSIIFSTHRMEQVEEICEHIVLIHKGENVLEGKVNAIKDQFKKNRFRIEFEGPPPPKWSVPMTVVEQNDHHMIVQLEEEIHSNKLLQDLLSHGLYIKHFEEILPSLNEIFIRQVEG